MAKMLINKDLKLIAKLHHLHRLIAIASNSAAKKALKDMPSFVEATAEDDPSDAEHPPWRPGAARTCLRRHSPPAWRRAARGCTK